jgi:hypothetical protein
MKRVVLIRETKTRGFSIRSSRELAYQPTLVDAVETARIWDFPCIRFVALNGTSGRYLSATIGIAAAMAAQAGKEPA